MEYNIYYNGQETSDFDTLAGWFQEVYGKMLSLKEANKQLREANEQYRDDYTRLKHGYDEFKILNRSLESDIDILKEEKKILKSDIDKLKKENEKNNGVIVTLEDSLKDKIDYAKELEEDRRKTKEVLEKYCGKYVTGPIPTIVGAIIDDYFYQKAETENQVRALQKAEKTIEGLNKELVGYADKVADHRERINELEEVNKNWEKRLWDPDWSRLIDKLDEIIAKEAPYPLAYKKVYTNADDEIWGKLNYLAMEIRIRNNSIQAKDCHIRELENKVNDLDATNRRLKLENEKLIHVQGDNAIKHATEITDLKREISALEKELEERKNKRSPRWLSDVMRICVLEDKVNELTRENERLRYSQPWMYERSRYSQPWMYGMSSKEATNRIFGVNGTIHKLREENDKLKDALEFCQKEASSARVHAHNIEFNAERIRKGLD